MTESSVDPQPTPKGSGSRKAATFDQERLVRRYLSGIESARPGRGTKRTSDAIGNRITKVDEMLVSADPLSRVHLTQERIELHAEYVRVNNGNHPDQSQFERGFIRVARSYGDRNGITYAAWRQVGVEAKVLERAGIHKAEKKLPPAARAAANGGDKPGRDKPDRDKPDKDKPAVDEQPEPEASETKADRVADDAVAELAPTEAQAAGTAEATADPSEEPTEAVSMDELAALLADASVGSAPATSSTQPRLGDELEAADDDAPVPAARRKPRPGTDEKNGA